MTTTRKLRWREVPCPVCGSLAVDPVAVGAAFEDSPPGATGDPDRNSYLVGECRGCGLLYLNPRPSQVDGPDLEDLYEPRCLHRLTHGDLSETAALVLTGEVSSATDRRSFSHLAAAGSSFRTVWLVHALERCPDPHQLLADVRDLLRPGGEVLILGGNPGSWSFRVFGGRHWHPYDFPRRHQFFRAHVLRELAERQGYEVVETSTRIDARAWIASLRNLLVDWNAAPRWIRHFDRARVLLNGLGFLLEGLARPFRRSALLFARLRLIETPGRDAAAAGTGTRRRRRDDGGGK